MADSEAAPEKAISNVKELMARLDKLGDGDFVYRGQANANWLLKSGAVRRVQGKRLVNSAKCPDSDDVLDYVLELANNARSLGLEFHGGTKSNCCDLKVLAELQHHGAATNLLDFSRNVLVALWMVCSEQFDKDGKIFVVNLLDDEFEELDVKEAERIPIPELFKKSKIQVWTPERFVARIQSQSSVFLIAPDESKINCHEILVDKDSKRKLLRTLAEMFSLTEAQVYPDLPGFARANRTEMPCYTRHENYYVRKAEKFASKENKEEALRFFKKAKKVGDQNAYVFFRSGLFHGKNGDSAGGIKDYDKAIELNPNYSAAYNNRGNLRKGQGDLVEARADYDKAIELNPNYSAAYNNRGNLRKGQGDLVEARADYDKAIELNPNYADAYSNRGILRYEQRDSEGARKDYDKAIELNPNYADAYSNRGILRRDQGDLVGARADYDKAIELNPNYSNAYLNKALLLEKKGKIPEAIACCKTCIQLKPDDPRGPKILAELEEKLKG